LRANDSSGTSKIKPLWASSSGDARAATGGSIRAHSVDHGNRLASSGSLGVTLVQGTQNRGSWSLSSLAFGRDAKIYDPRITIRPTPGHNAHGTTLSWRRPRDGAQADNSSALAGIILAKPVGYRQKFTLSEPFGNRTSSRIQRGNLRATARTINRFGIPTCVAATCGGRGRRLNR
jgi:hypothetical protein